MKFIPISSDNIVWNLKLSAIEAFSEPKSDTAGIWHISLSLKGKDKWINFTTINKESAVAQYKVLLAAFGMTA